MALRYLSLLLKFAPVITTAGCVFLGVNWFQSASDNRALSSKIDTLNATISRLDQSIAYRDIKLREVESDYTQTLSAIAEVSDDCLDRDLPLPLQQLFSKTIDR